MKIAIFQFQLFGINTYLVYDTKTSECAIIDPGMISGEEEDALYEFITENRLKVTNIINTHLHIDHAVGNNYSKTAFRAPVKGNKADEPLGVRMKQQAMMFGMAHEFKNVKIDEYLEDGDTVRIGDGALQVIAVPGHSPGSIALYDEKDGFVIVGDALFQGSIGRTDLPGGDHRQLLDSISKRLFSLPDDTIVYPGHGNPTTIGVEKRTNPFFK